jgi:sulfur carrier protein ThiS adenylyltransferase
MPTDSSPPEVDRYIRQRDIIPGDRLKDMNAIVIGVGAIGSQVAKQLTHIGVGTLTLIDPDEVSTENLAPQGFDEDDVGQPKVCSVAATCGMVNSEVEIVTHHERFAARHLGVGNLAIFMCVDDMNARISIAKMCKEETFVVDGRMSAEVMRILTFWDRESYEAYTKTLFGSDEAFEESCTSKSTIYCANVAAGMMVGQFTKWLRGFPLTKDFELNILSLELCENVETEAPALV